MEKISDLVIQPVLNKYKKYKQPKSVQIKREKKERTWILPSKDMGFYKFCEFFSYPEYGGLYNWQIEHEKLTENAKYETTRVARDHGKSVKYCKSYQYRMQYKELDVLLLGWTARFKQIAVYVYTFFYKYGLVEKDNRTSPFHFRIKNGGRFDAYLITSKETLGMHSEGEQDRWKNITETKWDTFKSFYNDVEWKELKSIIEEDENKYFNDSEFKEFLKVRKTTNRKLWIAIDDPIDITFRKERYKEESLEMRFDSTLYSINPDKWSFTGTRKFDGDFFDFIDNKFGDKLVKYVRGPINKDGSLLCPERFTHPSLPTYERDILNYEVNLVDYAGDIKLEPILDKDGKRIKKEKKKDLEEIRKDIGEYVWSADWLQHPHPVTGEVWDHIAVVDALELPVMHKYDICWITIDRATTRKDKITTQKKKPDYTGCVYGLREIKTGCRIITHDYTGYIDLDVLLLKINDFVIKFKAQHEHYIQIIIIVETQGGGSDFVTLARNSVMFVREDGSTVINQICDLCTIEELHNTGIKETRIRDRLYAPIKNERLKIMDYLLRSVVAEQILNFPYGDKVDGIDGLANMEFILLEKYQAGISKRLNEVNKVLDDYTKGIYSDDDDELIGEPVFNTGSVNIKRRRRTVF